MLEPEGTTAAGAWEPPKQLLELARSDAGLLPELIAAFQDDTRARLQHVRAAADAGDSPRLRTELHTIKGASWQIGASGLADACGQCERHAAAPSPAGLAGAIELIESRFATACAAMSRYLAGR